MVSFLHGDDAKLRYYYIIDEHCCCYLPNPGAPPSGAIAPNAG